MRSCSDPSPNAYEKLVDRLLASPRYGERMALRWLDAARYADTNGYQSDGVRDMWRWRDWVIDAFNRNMPFDRFTIEQLAGDLLPHRHARPAHRHRLQSQSPHQRRRRHHPRGVSASSTWRTACDTTATVWMGLTVGCARCHDHKYDPILQKDFYQLFAYFNNVPGERLCLQLRQRGAATSRRRFAGAGQKLDELDRKVAAAQARLTPCSRDRKPRSTSGNVAAASRPALRDWIPDGRAGSSAPDGRRRKAAADVTGEPNECAWPAGEAAQHFDGKQLSGTRRQRSPISIT